ncbi:RING-HC finger protein [bacterium]|nr:RING-HC finger protein [bacterium]
MAPVRNLYTLHAENESGNCGITVIKIRACGRGYEVVSKKEYNTVSADLLQLVKGRGKFIEYNRVYPYFEDQHGIPLTPYSELTFDVESLVRVSSFTSDDVYGVWEFKACVTMFHKYCVGTMLIREISNWYENARKRKWLKINSQRALKRRMRVCFTVWASHRTGVYGRLETYSTVTWFPSIRPERQLCMKTGIQTFVVDTSYARGEHLFLKENGGVAGPAAVVRLKQDVKSGDLVSFHIPLNWSDLVDEESKEVELASLMDPRYINKVFIADSDVPTAPVSDADVVVTGKHKPKTRRGGVKKKKKKLGEDAASITGEASSSSTPLPIVDEDEELVLEANEASVVVQNLSELAISVDAALDDGNDAASVVQSSVASAQACIVCFENAMEAACIPCGHRCLCVDCADRFRHPGAKCPVCRVDLLMVVKIWG